ncbi:uncharacterized protein [Spinacia oleracea]|uniref:RRM domain-containing protein n=1 Tax=Spinacia oleracea TaxID=3562 RepID=A0A9R0IPP9_SPIOL|nr:uncharacterized protein LOC110792789 [Spinacia oleracea]
MSGRVGRDYHSRRDNVQQQHHHPRHQNHHSSSSSRFEESKSGRGKNPPSRHLWVGNLSNHIDQSTLTDEFIRFGDLENIAYHPGRSYAFVNFIREDDAIAALNSLQGFSLGGMPLRIEFAKSDKSSAPPRDELYLPHRDEVQPRNKSSAFPPRESRKRHASPDAYFPDSPRINERGTDHPTEILWIGFPSCLKVDEAILRKAFSPFGDIDKITAFPGRTYAFVQFRHLASACRAKETLQGKLFGNPRVHISFARKENASSAGGRRITGPNAPASPHFKSTVRTGSSDHLRSRRNVRESEDPSMRTPHFPDMEYGDPDIMKFSRLESQWTHTSGSNEDRRFHELGPDVGSPQRRRGYCRSPFRDGNSQFNDFSSQNFRRKNPYPEDPRELPEDTYSYHGGKKMKIDSFPHDELPEYPLHNAEQDKHVFHGFAPEPPLSDESRPPFPYRERLPENPPSYNRSLGDRHDNWGSSHAPPTSSSNPVEWKRSTELHKPGPKEWKWEGTIAKGGTPVCRARCFPVGKVMDFFLPELLDCTARTGLDMLSKHYYQAACSWVVFFVPANDGDMEYYNEFMHYLGEKQRAAVAKLDDRNTLFLVPPSDFSENVLKIPGKLSISGVVLSLEPSSPTLESGPEEYANKGREVVYSHVDTSYSKLQSSSGPSCMAVSYSNLENSGVNNASLQGNIKTSAPSLFSSYGYQPVPMDSTLHAYPVSEGYNNSNSGSVNYDGSIGYEHKLPSLAQGLKRQTPNDIYRSSGFTGNQHENLSSRYTTNQVSSDISPSPFSMLQQQQQQQQQQQSTQTETFTHTNPVGLQGTINAQDDGEADPQKRLQATLQLAAALLQQIQQGKAP